MYSHLRWSTECLVLSRLSFVLDCVKSLNVKFCKCDCGGLSVLLMYFHVSVFMAFLLACKRSVKSAIMIRLLQRKGFNYNFTRLSFSCLNHLGYILSFDFLHTSTSHQPQPFQT